MKTETYDKTHTQYPQALKRAEDLLKLPIEQLKEKLRERSGWGADRLPTADELAILILIWVDEENARRGV